MGHDTTPEDVQPNSAPFAIEPITVFPNAVTRQKHQSSYQRTGLPDLQVPNPQRFQTLPTEGQIYLNIK